MRCRDLRILAMFLEGDAWGRVSALQRRHSHKGSSFTELQRFSIQDENTIQNRQSLGNSVCACNTIHLGSARKKERIPKDPKPSPVNYSTVTNGMHTHTRGILADTRRG